MDACTFSVVVPVYNCERYIEACIFSILNQTYQAFELIVVDDESTDASADIVQRMIEGKQNCRILRNSHGGVCKARNAGLDIAVGEYICFVDADDILFDDYLENLANASKCFSPDVMYFYTKYGVDSEERKEYGQSTFLELESKDIEMLSRASLYHIPELYDSTSGLWGISSFSAWGQVYRRDIYDKNQIRFTEGITLSEDGLFNLETLHYVKSAVVVRKELYNYRMGNVSATRSYKPDLNRMFALRDEKVKSLIERLYSEKREEYMKMYYCSLIYQLRVISENSIFHTENKNSWKEKAKKFSCLCKQTDYAYAIENCGDYYLRSEEERYLRYAQQQAPHKIVLNLKKQHILGGMRRAIRNGLRIMHIDKMVMNLWRKIR